MSLNPVQLSRRAMLRLALTGALGALLAACQRATEPLTGSSTPAPPAQRAAAQIAPTLTAVPPAADSVPITPNSGFYRITSGPDPNIPPDWKLTLTGLVDQPLTFTLEEIKAMPSVTEMRTLECIENHVGGAFPDGVLQMPWVQLLF